MTGRRELWWKICLMSWIGFPPTPQNHQACVLHPHTHCQSSPTECWRCCSDNHIISSFVSPCFYSPCRDQCVDTREYTSTNTVSSTLLSSDQNSAHHTEGTKYKWPEITTCCVPGALPFIANQWSVNPPHPPLSHLTGCFSYITPTVRE